MRRMCQKGVLRIFLQLHFFIDGVYIHVGDVSELFMATAFQQTVLNDAAPGKACAGGHLALLIGLVDGFEEFVVCHDISLLSFINQ